MWKQQLCSLKASAVQCDSNSSCCKTYSGQIFLPKIISKSWAFPKCLPPCKAKNIEVLAYYYTVGFAKNICTRVTMLPILSQNILWEQKSILNTSLYAAVCAPQFVNETKYTVKNTVVLRSLCLRNKCTQASKHFKTKFAPFCLISSDAVLLAYVTARKEIRGILS